MAGEDYTTTEYNSFTLDHTEDLWTAATINDSFFILNTPKAGGRYFIKNNPIEAGIYLFITGTASILGTFGNILVMASFAVNPALQNSKNVFIFNVALAEILVTAIVARVGFSGP